MLRDIIKKEILDNITSPKFVFTFLLCTVLILLSVYTGVANYGAEQEGVHGGRGPEQEEPGEPAELHVAGRDRHQDQ